MTPSEETKLQSILLSRDVYNQWMYSARIDINRETEINQWLPTNCQKKYKIFIGYSKQCVFFESESDFVSYKLTWL